MTTAAGLDPIEARLCDAIATRVHDLYGDLERWVAIPTGGRHRAGLDDLRGLVLERLVVLDARVTLERGDPRPAWLALPDDPRGDDDHIPPTAIASRLHVAGGSGPRVLLAGHLDTVHDPRGAFRTLVRESDTVCRGPGAVDMKGGIVIAVHALEALAAVGVPVRWSFLLNSDEETGSFHSARHLEEAARGHDVGLALEPASDGGGLVVERMGTGQFRIDAFGRAAHVGRDYAVGVSAVRALAKAIIDVEGFGNVERGAIVNVGPLVGGRVTNAVPDRATCWGNVRFRDGDTQADLSRRFAGVATTSDALPRLVVETAFNRPAKPKTSAVERLAHGVRRVSEDLGRPLPFTSTGGVCDGNILQSVGLPTLDTLGVRGGNLHRTDEWVEIPSLVDRCQLLALVLRRLALGAIAP
ncbi:MAG: M20/M25/M40 family metallo-hydrolase [Phycisphaerae bacterium]|nr:M20/M25/M40 family metallo-hydrolase [Phycisphaerae bacterium]